MRCTAYKVAPDDGLIQSETCRASSRKYVLITRILCILLVHIHIVLQSIVSILTPLNGHRGIVAEEQSCRQVKFNNPPPLSFVIRTKESEPVLIQMAPRNIVEQLQLFLAPLTARRHTFVISGCFVQIYVEQRLRHRE